MTTIDLDLRIRQADRRKQTLWTIALCTSLLLHGLLLVLVAGPLPWHKPPVQDEVPVTVDLVPVPPMPVTSPQPVKPEPPKVEPKPEAPKGVEPQIAAPPPVAPQAKNTDAAGPAPQGGKPAATAKALPPPPPPKPNLHADKVTEKSHNPSITVVPEERKKSAPHDMDPASRTISDLILTQVSAIWSPPDQLRGLGSNITLVIDVLPNGMFGPPFAADDPWNPAAALVGYNQMQPGDPRRSAMTNFYRALRDIQPIQLPPDLAAKGTRSVPVRFMLDDMP